jgi:hypothetical protein
MRTRRLVLGLIAVAMLAPAGSSAADPCDPPLAIEYTATEAVLHFELDTVGCPVYAPIRIVAVFSRDGLLDGMAQAVETSCPTTDICVVDVVLEHGPIEHAEYEGVVSYESVWDGGFLSGGVFLWRRCVSVVATNECFAL